MLTAITFGVLASVVVLVVFGLVTNHQEMCQDDERDAAELRISRDSEHVQSLNAVLQEMVRTHAETQKELLRLVSILAVRTAAAEQSTIAFPATSDARDSRAGETNWEALDNNEGQDRLSYLAEALRGVKSPDGGDLVDP